MRLVALIALFSRPVYFSGMLLHCLKRIKKMEKKSADLLVSLLKQLVQ